MIKKVPVRLKYKPISIKIYFNKNIMMPTEHRKIRGSPRRGVPWAIF